MLSMQRGLLIVALALSAGAIAEDAKPQPERRILERHDQAGVPGKEVVIGTASLPAGTAIGFHEHPGDEVGYIIKGSVIWKVRANRTRP